MEICHLGTYIIVPQNWERIQVDVATWMHPQTKAKYHILLVVDEGSRFRIAKVISFGEGNQRQHGRT